MFILCLGIGFNFVITVVRNILFGSSSVICLCYECCEVFNVQMILSLAGGHGCFYLRK